MSDDRSIDVIVAFGIGLIAGAAAALLMAPTSGEESRRRIGETARDVGEKVRERSREVGEQVKDRSRETSDKLREQTDQVLGEVKAQAARVGQAFEEGKKTYFEKK
jgi:gas vesicle protein